MDEVEIKILEVDAEKIRRILRKNNAKFVKKVLQRDVYYENDDTRGRDIGVRVRDEGDRVIIAVKGERRIIRGHKVRDEYELDVEDSKTAEKMFELMGFRAVRKVEKRREYFRWHNCSVEIIEMPKIPIFIEIEGKEEDILKVARGFGYSEKDYFAGFSLHHYNIKDKFLVFEGK